MRDFFPSQMSVVKGWMHVLEPGLQTLENGAEVTLSWGHCDARGRGRPNPDGATGDHLFVPMFGASRPRELRRSAQWTFMVYGA